MWELDEVVALAGEKIKSKLGEISNQFLEVMDIKEAHHQELERKVSVLEERLETSHVTNLLLATLVTLLQG